MSVQAVKQLLSPVAALVFFCGHCPHISVSPFIKVPYGVVMGSMTPVPAVVGCKNKVAEKGADYPAGPGRFKKGTVSEVMKYNKNTNQEAGRQTHPLG